MNKHSKAPWKLKYNKGDAFRIYSADGYDLLCIADDERYGRPEEDAANARLVRVAPCLLKNLKEAIDELEYQYSDANEPGGLTDRNRLRIIKKCRRTIARAEKRKK